MSGRDFGLRLDPCELDSLNLYVNIARTQARTTAEPCDALRWPRP